MKKYVIEQRTTLEIEWKGEVACSYEKPEFLVKRAADDYPIRLFDYYFQAEQLCRELNAAESDED